MKKVSMAVLSLWISSFVLSGAVSAGETKDSELVNRISRIEEQLKQGSGGKWAKRMTFSGAIEVEAGYEKKDFADPHADDEDASDIALSTVELGVDVDIAKHVKGSVLFLYEDDEDVVVDEGFIMLEGFDAVPLYMKLGKIYLPFGKFETNMISDPLTLEWAETRQSAVEAGFTMGDFYASGYVFNGDTDKDSSDDNHISNYGVTVGYAVKRDKLGMDIGIGYINNIVDSNGWADVLEEERAGAESMGISFAFEDYVPGLSLHGIVNFGGFKVMGEYITMVEDPEWNLSELEPGAFETAGCGPVAYGEKLETWNAEVGYTAEISGKETTFGLAYQGCDNGENFFPESRLMTVVSVGIFEETTVALEYRHDQFENDDKANVVTAQLAMGF